MASASKKGRFACCAGRRQCVPPSCILYEIWQVSLKSSVVKEKIKEKKEKKKLKKVLTNSRRYSILIIVLRNTVIKSATVAQLVEHDLAKVGVAGSNPHCRF